MKIKITEQWYCSSTAYFLGLEIENRAGKPLGDPQTKIIDTEINPEYAECKTLEDVKRQHEQLLRSVHGAELFLQHPTIEYAQV